jgi:hypothetical protein
MLPAMFPSRQSEEEVSHRIMSIIGAAVLIRFSPVEGKVGREMSGHGKRFAPLLNA